MRPARFAGMAVFVQRTTFTAAHAAVVSRAATTVSAAVSAVTVTGTVARMAAVVPVHVAMMTATVVVVPCLRAAHRRLVGPVLHNGHRTEAYRSKQH